MAGVRDSVRKALDDAFCDGIKGLYSAALAKVAGGESVDAAMKEFNAGILLEVAKLHARLLTEAEATMNNAGIT
jgi:hypothetical protein